MKITVTKSHIDEGVRRDSHCCMIADAIKEACPNAQYVLVDLQSIRFSDPESRERFIYLTPRVAQHNLLKFDKGEKNIKPFEFRLQRPQVRGMGWQAQANRTAKNRKGAKRYKATGKRRHVVAYKEREFGLRKFVDEKVQG